MRYVTVINDEKFDIQIEKNGKLLVNGEPRHVDFRALGSSLYSILMDDQSFQVAIEEDQGHHSVLMQGRLYEGQVLDERAMLLAQRHGPATTGSGELKAPMPGLIVSINFEIGQTVNQGETCVILESMKMQNEIKAPVSGVVKSIAIKPGDTVNKNDILLIVTPDTNDDSEQ
jgi:biotin carboxyl carrier protein